MGGSNVARNTAASIPTPTIRHGLSLDKELAEVLATEVEATAIGFSVPRVRVGVNGATIGGEVAFPQGDEAGAHSRLRDFNKAEMARQLRSALVAFASPADAGTARSTAQARRA